jgi:phosphate-selective porin
VGNYFLAVVVSCLFVIPALAEEPPADAGPPSIHTREWLSINLRSKIQFDFGSFRPQLDDERILQGRRARFGAEGTLLRDLDFTLQVETGKGQAQLRDAFLRYRPLLVFQIQAGQFKIPVGLDQMTDSGDLDFVERSRIGRILSPGRDVGAIILGETMERRLQYSAGVFQHDGRNSQIRDLAIKENWSPGGNRTVAARITFTPVPVQVTGAALRNLKVGVAFAASHVPAGLSSLPGTTVSDQVFFPRMYVNGLRQRWEADVRWRISSFSIQGELMHLRDQRLGQGFYGENLPPLRMHGGYLSIVHPLFGNLKPVSGPRLYSILPGTHLGLFEATARYEMIAFGSASAAGSPAPSPSPRAANVMGNDDHAWTFGINWRANPYVKFQFNGVREMLRDPSRVPIDGQNVYWSMITRAQIYF